MSRRMANLLASLITMAIVSMSVHLYLGKDPPGGTRPADTEEAPTVRTSFAGIAPRQELRLELEEGYVEVNELRLWQRVTRTEGPAPAELAPDAPGDLVNAELGGVEITSVTGGIGSPGGEREAIFRVRFKVKEADEETLRISWKMLSTEEIPHGDNPAWLEAVKKAKKLRGESLIERTGMPLEAEIKGLSASDPVGLELETLLRRWFAEPSPVFPYEPVGHGGVWEVTRSTTDAAVRTRQTQRYEIRKLIERTGRVRFGERVSGELLSTDIDLGPMLAPFDPMVDRFSVDGDGGWETGPGALMATGDAGGRASVHFGLTLGAASMGLETTMESELLVTRIE